MDPITHGLTGSLLGKAFFVDRYGRTATVAVTLGALFPDIDWFLWQLAGGDIGSAREWHRTITHSFVTLPAFAALLAVLTRYLAPRRWRGRPKFLALWALYALGLASHIVLDLVTVFGVMIWSPLSSTLVAWELVFLIDFPFTAIVLLPQVAAWIYREGAHAPRRGVLAWVFFTVFTVAMASIIAPAYQVPYPIRVVLVVSSLIGLIFLLPAWPVGRPAIQRWGFRQPRAVFCRIGIAALLGYIAVCATSHHLAVKRTEAVAQQKQLEVQGVGVLPDPFHSIFGWSGIIVTPAGYHHGVFSLLDAHAPEFKFLANSTPNLYIDIAESLPSVQTFRWWASRFALVSYRSQAFGSGHRHIVEYADPCFWAGRARRRCVGAVFRVTLNEAGEVLSAGALGDWERLMVTANKAYEQGDYARAETLYRRALEVLEKAQGPEHPNVAEVLENYAGLLRKMNREAEAEKLEARAHAIRAQHALEKQPK